MQKPESFQTTRAMFSEQQDRIAALRTKLVKSQEKLYDIMSQEPNKSRNTPLQHASTDIKMLQASIRREEELLKRMIIMNDCDCKEGVASVGTRLILHISPIQAPDKHSETATPVEMDVILDGKYGENKDGVRVISSHSPIGAVVIGAMVGEKRTFSSATGDEFEVEVLSITKVPTK